MFENDHPTLSDLQCYHRELDAAKGFHPNLYFNMLLLQEEVGELASVMTRVWCVEQRTGDLDAALDQHHDGLAEELADCLAYVVKLANYAGVNLEAAYLAKMRRNLKREWRDRGEMEQGIENCVPMTNEQMTNDQKAGQHSECCSESRGNNDISAPV